MRRLTRTAPFFGRAKGRHQTVITVRHELALSGRVDSGNVVRQRG